MINNKLRSAFNEVNQLINDYKYDDAINKLNKIMMEYRGYDFIKSITIYNKALIYEKKAEYNKAIKNLEKAFKIKNYSEILFKEYEIYIYKNELNKALETINRIIDNDETIFFGYDLKFNFLFEHKMYE